MRGVAFTVDLEELVAERSERGGGDGTGPSNHWLERGEPPSERAL